MRRSIIAILSLLTVGLTACGGAQGDVCQVDSDCQSGLVCDKPATAMPTVFRSTCQSTRSAPGLPDSGPRPDSGPLPDSGPTEQDAGMPDTGTPDAGATDAGAGDAGAVDAGFDAGAIDAGTDAGVDAGA